MAEVSTVARPYAKAAFEYAQEKGALTQWSNMLAQASAVANILGIGVLGGKFLEGAARQPEMIPMLRTQLFIVMGLVDAVPMIGVGISLYILFAVA